MKSQEEDSLHLDEVLKKFGAFGRYQIQALLLLSFAFFNNGMHCINYVMVAEDVPYRCRIEQCDSSSEVFETSWYNFTTPRDYSSCYKYGSVLEECSTSSFNTSIVEPCSEWIYKSEQSFVAEFGLACQDWKRTFVGTVHNIGLMFGLFFQGQLSDRIGRKSTIIIAGMAAAIFGLAKSYAGTYLIFLFLEFLEALFGDNCSPAFIMSVELVHSDHRLQQQIFFCVILAIGGVMFSATAYIVPYWRDFVRVIYAPSLLFVLFYFVMDESVRWLLSKGKKKEAIKVLLKMAKTNKVSVKEEFLVNIKCEDNITKNSPMRDTFKSKIIIKRFVICTFWWISCTFITFGLVVNIDSLGGNKYLNFGIMSLSDIPVSFAMVYILKRFNRKKPLFVSFVSAGTLCLMQSFVPKEYVLLSTGLYFGGRFVSTFTFATVYMYTSELFPTYSRNSMHALCSSIGRIGSVLAPMTPLLIQYSENLPTLLIGSISIVAGLTTLLVPDVANEPLPDNVQQAESIGESQLKIQLKENINTNNFI